MLAGEPAAWPIGCLTRHPSGEEMNPELGFLFPLLFEPLGAGLSSRLMLLRTGGDERGQAVVRMLSCGEQRKIEQHRKRCRHQSQHVGRKPLHACHVTSCIRARQFHLGRKWLPTERMAKRWQRAMPPARRPSRGRAAGRCGHERAVRRCRSGPTRQQKVSARPSAPPAAGPQQQHRRLPGCRMMFLGEDVPSTIRTQTVFAALSGGLHPLDGFSRERPRVHRMTAKVPRAPRQAVGPQRAPSGLPRMRRRLPERAASGQGILRQ
jgi:hypothetical protein